MKLQKKINIYFISVSLIVFLVSSIVSFFVIKDLVVEEVDETLEAEKNNLIIHLEKYGRPEKILENNSYRLEIFPYRRTEHYTQLFSDTLLYVKEEREGVPFRQLKAIQNIKGKTYQIILRRSLIERDDLIAGISVLIVSLFLLVIISLNLIIYFGGKKWWSPFYDTLKKLADFNINRQNKTKFNDSEIDEFNELNNTLEKMTDQLVKDYRNLKEFSENASHEMQTPLAIIRSKLDVMIQDKSLTEKQFESIQILYDAVNRLTKLNHMLNLLTKIENKEFEDKEEINLSRMIEKQINNLNEFISIKSLRIQKEIAEKVVLIMNRFMAESLISNLIYNGVKHNINNGEISVLLNREELIIKNSGEPPKGPTNEYFKRFKKGKQTSDSSGLGLSIAKSICDANKFEIDYSYVDKLHIIRVKFRNNG